MAEQPEKVEKTDQQWRQELTPEQYRVLREHDTEAPFSGQYVNVTDRGSYQCVGCGTELFRSETKFDAHCGWPSFWAGVAPERITRRRDWSMIVPRTEILCAKCDGHLGHVFDDGPEPTGERFCVNSVALKFTRDQAVKLDGAAGTGTNEAQ